MIRTRETRERELRGVEYHALHSAMKQTTRSTMRAALILLTTLAIHVMCEAQGKVAQKPASDKLWPLKPLIDISMIMDKLNWQSYASFRNEENAPLRADTMPYIVSAWILRAKTDSSLAGYAPELKLITKYEMQLARMYDGMNLIGDRLGEFYVSKSSPPIRFCMNNDTAMTLLLPCIHIGATFNTLQLTSRQRATEVVTKYLLSCLSDVTGGFSDTEVKYVALSATYGSKDFLDESLLALQPEMVCIVVPMNRAKTFVDGTITEDELVTAMDVYVSDRDMVDAKKIKIVIE